MCHCPRGKSRSKFRVGRRDGRRRRIHNRENVGHRPLWIDSIELSAAFPTIVLRRLKIGSGRGRPTISPGSAWSICSSNHCRAATLLSQANSPTSSMTRKSGVFPARVSLFEKRRQPEAMSLKVSGYKPIITALIAYCGGCLFTAAVWVRSAHWALSGSVAPRGNHARGRRCRGAVHR